MKTIVLATTLVFGAMVQAHASDRNVDLVLEPCMNGGVSASGLYQSQAQEDRARNVAFEASGERARESR